MNYAYLRVSTDKQDADNQRHAITCAKGDTGLVFVEEVVSGKVSWRSRKLGALVESLKSGDSITVAELSRLGRSMLEVMELLSVLMTKRVRVYSLKEGFDLGDNIQSKVLAFAFSLASEIERQLISQRTTEALARKKSEGVILGRRVGCVDTKKRKRRSDYGTVKSARP